MTNKIALGKEFLGLLIDAGLISPLTRRVTISADYEGLLEIDEERLGSPDWLEKLAGADLSEFGRLKNVEKLAAKMVKLQNDGLVDSDLGREIDKLING